LAGLHSLLHENLLFEVAEDPRSSAFPCFFGGRFQTVFFVVFSAHLLILGSQLTPFGRLQASFFDKLWSPGACMGSQVGPGSPKVGPGSPKDSLWECFWVPFERIFVIFCPNLRGRGYVATFCTLERFRCYLTGFWLYFAYIWGAWLRGHILPIAGGRGWDGSLKGELCRPGYLEAWRLEAWILLGGIGWLGGSCC